MGEYEDVDERLSSRGRDAVSDPRRWKYEVLMTELLWGSKDKVGSRMQPGLRARGEREMVELSMVIGMGPVLWRVDPVRMRRISVLSALS